MSEPCGHPAHFTGEIIDSRGQEHTYGQCRRCGAIAVNEPDKLPDNGSASNSKTPACDHVHDDGSADKPAVNQMAPTCSACARCTPHEPHDGWGDCEYEAVNMPVPLKAPRCRYGFRLRPRVERFRFSRSVEVVIERECGPLGR